MAAWTRRTARAMMSALLFCGIPVAAPAADSRSLFLEHLSTRDGLPQGTVYATLQDSQGFVWLGTEDGLVRYDGHDIYRYAYSSRAGNSLPGNFVFALAEDKHRDIWVAVKGSGLARWNRATDTFTVFRHDEQNSQSIASDFVRTLLVDAQDRVWIGTLDAGVDVLTPSSGQIAHLRHSDSAESLVNDEVYALLEDHHGAVWVGTGAGVDRWSLAGTHFEHPAPAGSADPMLINKQVRQFADGDDGTVWVGTFDAGVFHVDASGRVIANIRHAPGEALSLSSDEVHAVLNDHAGHIWIGTAEGLDYLSAANSRIGHYAHDNADPSSLSDSFVMSLYEDGAGLLWIGTRAGGVNRWNSRSWELGGNRPSWLDGKSVTAFADAPDNHIWVATLGGGLFNVDLHTGDALNLDTLLHAHDAIGDRRVMSLHRDRRGNLWIGTWAQGIKKLTPEGQVVSVPVRAGDPHSLSAAGVAAIFEAKDGRLWIGTHGGGANVLDPVTGLIRQLPFSSAPGSTNSENVTSFAEDKEGHIWIGTENGGINIAHADGEVYKVLNHAATDPRSLSSNIIYALTVDPSGNVWVATDGGGLDLALGSSNQPDSLGFQTFSLSEGLSSDTIYSVLPDATGHLWLSGNSGLMRFDPSTRSVKTYHREHGLQGEEFNSGAYLRTQDGRLCFGGPDGFNIFDPQSLSTDSRPPRIALTGLEILGAPVHRPSPYWVLDQIPLDYQAAVVSFDFAALDFTSPARNRLAYRVTGLTDKWIDLNSQRRVTLTNLDAGDHVLEVRAANADSIWSTTPYRLTIHKQAAPWRSAAAYSLYAALIVAFILWSLRAQRAKLTRALASKQRLESEVALRTKELREKNQQLIVAGEAKSDFLSRMGHELRTPMNGVVGMAELIARSPLNLTQARQIQTIRSSARTLLQILNDLLDLSKAQAGKIELEELPMDLAQLIEECASIFSGAAESKGLELIMCPAVNERVHLRGDALRLRQIMMNLIGNAIKFTEQGEVVISWDVTPSREGTADVNIVVADTGVGISASALTKIFEPFTQADETTTRRFGGTGLGLSICHQLVELMGGVIAVESQPRSGSTFSIRLTLKVAGADASVGAGASVDTAAEATVDQAPASSTAAMLILTRRRSLGDSLQRHAALLGYASRMGEPSDVGIAPAGTVIVIDADSYPGTVSQVLFAPTAEHIIIVASAAEIEVQSLATRVPEAHLLRNPISRDALRLSVGASPTSGVDTVLTRSLTVDPPLRAHVLIVEDESVNGAVAEGYLAELGCSSVWVTDGAAAIARSAVERFDLIFMDLNMPGLDGYETARHIRAAEVQGRRVPIIALTANNAAAYRDSCEAAGMQDILTKPYTLGECEAVLKRWGNEAKPDLASLDLGSVAGLRSIGGPKNGLFAKLVALFTKSSADALGAIGEALRTRDLVRARALAHKLKGAAGNVGALVFAAQAERLEQRCAANDADAALSIFDQLRASLPALLNELNHMSLQESA